MKTTQLTLFPAEAAAKFAELKAAVETLDFATDHGICFSAGRRMAWLKHQDEAGACKRCNLLQPSLRAMMTQ